MEKCGRRSSAAHRGRAPGDTAPTACRPVHRQGARWNRAARPPRPPRSTARGHAAPATARNGRRRSRRQPGRNSPGSVEGGARSRRCTKPEPARRSPQYQRGPALLPCWLHVYLGQLNAHGNRPNGLHHISAQRIDAIGGIRGNTPAHDNTHPAAASAKARLRRGVGLNAGLKCKVNRKTRRFKWSACGVAGREGSIFH
jgi:hypothetical protein